MPSALKVQYRQDKQSSDGEQLFWRCSNPNFCVWRESRGMEDVPQPCDQGQHTHGPRDEKGLRHRSVSALEWIALGLVALYGSALAFPAPRCLSAEMIGAELRSAGSRWIGPSPVRVWWRWGTSASPYSRYTQYCAKVQYRTYITLRRNPGSPAPSIEGKGRRPSTLSRLAPLFYYLYQAVPTDRSLFTGCPKWLRRCKRNAGWEQTQRMRGGSEFHSLVAV